MITTQDPNQQTGLYSRIVEPRRSITPNALRARLQADLHPSTPTRNIFAGASGIGLVGRIAAWFRGER
jgi:hypothetical protein